LETLPYVDYKFIGIRSFTDKLDESKVSYVLFEDDTAERLFSAKSELLNRETDSIRTGRCTSEGYGAYFAEFGIRITKSYLSYIVFIYSHHPSFEDMMATADSLEAVITSNIDSVDLSEFYKGSEERGTSNN